MHTTGSKGLLPLVAIGLSAAALAWNSFARGEDGPRSLAIVPSAGERYAILVGVNGYIHFRSLKYCRNDVEKLHERLIAVGFSEKSVVVLSDDAEKKRYLPFAVNIKRELKQLLALADGAELVVVCFSGHGVHLAGQSYLCPLEASLEDPGETMVRLEEVYEQLRACKAKRKLLIVDACRNDPLPEGAKSPVDLTKSVDGFAKSLADPPKGVWTLLSCEPGQRSWEEAEFENGVFMHYVLQGLAGEADRESTGNHDNRVSLVELFQYAKANTKRHVQDSHASVQVPTLFGEGTVDLEITTVSPGLQAVAAFERAYASIRNVTFEECAKDNRGDEAIRGLSEAIRLNPDYAEAYMVRGLLYLAKKEGEKAIADFTEIIRIRPHKSGGYYLRGQANLEKGDQPAAIADFNEVLRLMPDDADAYAGRGCAYGRQGELPKALADLNKAVALKPENADFRRWRAMTYSDLGVLEAAIPDLTEAIRLSPQDARLRWMRGVAYRDQKASDKSLSDFSEAIRLASGDADVRAGVHFDRGVALVDQGRFNEALKDFTEAIRLAPGNPLPYFNRGTLLLQQNRLDEAIADFTEVIRINAPTAKGKSNRADAYCTRGMALAKKGEFQKAIADLTEAIKLNPDLTAAYDVRAKCYGSLQRYDEALADCNEVIRRSPRTAEYYYTRAEVYGFKNDLPRTLADYSQAIDLKPDYVDALLRRGTLYMFLMRGAVESAIADFSKVIELKPEGEQAFVARQHRATLYAGKGDRDKALADRSELIRIKPNDSGMYVERGRVYAQFREVDPALADFQHAIEIDSGNAYAYLLRGTTWDAKGDAHKALADYNRAIELGYRLAPPSRVLARLFRGELYLGRGQLDQALADANEAGQLEPNDPEVYGLRGRVYIKKGEPDLAVAEFTRAVDISERFAKGYLWRALAYVEKWKRAKAEAEQANAQGDSVAIQAALAKLKAANDAAEADLAKAKELGIKLDEPAAGTPPATPPSEKIPGEPTPPVPPSEELPMAPPSQTPPPTPPSDGFPMAPPGESGTEPRADPPAGAGSRDATPGIVATPAVDYLSTRDRIAFAVQIPQAMKLYKAANGRAPRSHEEFMREIIRANSIQLPELPPGEQYLYDPQREELMVERPAP